MVWRIKRTDAKKFNIPTECYVSNLMPETLGSNTKIKFDENITKAKSFSTQNVAETMKTTLLAKNPQMVLIVEEII